MRGPEARANLLWPLGGAPFFYVGAPDFTLLLPSSLHRKQPRLRQTGRDGGGKKRQPHAGTRARDAPPPPPQDSLISPRFSSPLPFPPSLPQSVLHPAGSRNEATRLAKGRGVNSRTGAERQARSLPSPSFRVPCGVGGVGEYSDGDTQSLSADLPPASRWPPSCAYRAGYPSARI